MCISSPSIVACINCSWELDIGNGDYTLVIQSLKSGPDLHTCHDTYAYAYVTVIYHYE